ncbi:type II toxin-antitoxin system VapC family toxin [Bosea sp. (in: a-proteobacteria)]|uniref:type II toxin-antitoxin system VapC family toxin n=1 Tax=Bosea sp. (in: a-proteobacteria) TaxID=1871050 RepID=UPI0025C2D187|nr:type II toxin-antitoxin system VapC family toxin [Bosea sp. (in: a-proteobacteria)]MBR3192644.1 type II toxin-antitoxin system VapC family toxin [Bosea sp. (in: a-proteobacteria)]
MASVIDASFTLAIFLPDEASPDAATIEEVARGVAVPRHWFAEVASGYVQASRRGRIGTAMVAELLKALEGLSVEPDEADALIAQRQSAVLALQYGLTVYDAAYLELALRLRRPLATFDTQLRAAALAAGVALL